MKPPNIRKEVVAQAQRTISLPGFKVDTRKLAERLVAVIGPMLFRQRADKTTSQASALDSQSAKSRSAKSSESLNESAKRETP